MSDEKEDIEYEPIDTAEDAGEVDGPTITGEALADAEVEDGEDSEDEPKKETAAALRAPDDDEDDSDDDDEEPKAGTPIIGEPYIEGECTVTLTMVIHPKDGHENGPLVTISASSHEKPGKSMINTRLLALGEMPAVIKDAIAQVNGNLETTRLEIEAAKAEEAAAQEKSKQDAANKKQAEKNKKAAQLKAKKDKEKKKKEAEKAKAAKQKAAEQAKAEKDKAAADKALADKQKESARALAEAQRAAQPVQPDLFSAAGIEIEQPKKDGE